MALRHAAVLRNPGSYVMSPTSSADVLICRRSTARIAPSWIGISYCLPVRLSTTARVSLGTRGILDSGWGKITSEGGESLVFSLPMTQPAPPKPASLYPTRSAAGALLGEQLAAKQVVIATPVGTQAAVERIRARRYELVCPSVVVEAKGHPAPFGDMTGETPERLRSIMIAHQAA